MSKIAPGPDALALGAILGAETPPDPVDIEYLDPRLTPSYVDLKDPQP